MADRRPVKPGELMGLAAAAGQEARVAAARRRMANIRLTEEERRVCTDELAEQFAVGRLDQDELHARVDRLNTAVTHADLQPVFAGLPTPSLYQPGPRKPSRWRWAAFAGAVWLAAPFFLTGLVLLLFGREVAAAIFGLPALLWTFVAYRWAAGKSKRSRRP
ncbi:MULTISPECIES: DUF1707 domain-containing protein [unclassified Kribbella]|uniref:DUF1707 SHOCT-like domain-containing protein n=1 Tax=unclassified Kribbella TaxID=2644121 RepID=UPI0033FE3E30